MNGELMDTCVPAFLHWYVPVPVAVNVIFSPSHTGPSLLAPAFGFAWNVICTSSSAVQPFASSTSKLYVPLVVTSMLWVLSPVLQS